MRFRLGSNMAWQTPGLLLLAAAVAWLVPSPDLGPDGSVAGTDLTDIRTATSFETADGVTLHADLYAGDDDSRPWLLLFHQAGANARAEYGPLVDRLLEAGYRVLATDQRNGGTRLGGTNRTVDDLPEDLSDPSYCDGYADLEATLDWLREEDPRARPVIWGSSYSAALVLRLAAEHPKEIRGVLAFSPASGDPMGECQPVPYARALAKTDTPVLLLRPAREMELEKVQTDMQTYRDLGLATYVADPGVHGSSMLNEERVEGDVEPAWNAVLEFLLSLEVEAAPAGR